MKKRRPKNETEPRVVVPGPDGFGPKERGRIVDQVARFMEDLNSNNLEKLRGWFNEESELWLPPAKSLQGAEDIIRLFRVIFRRFSEIDWKVHRFYPVNETTIIYESTSQGIMRDGAPYKNNILTLVEFNRDGKIRWLSDYFKDTLSFGPRLKPEVA